jgi:hypothetical protein
MNSIISLRNLELSQRSFGLTTSSGNILSVIMRVHLSAGDDMKDRFQKGRPFKMRYQALDTDQAA